MVYDPVAALRKEDQERYTALEQLGIARAELKEALDNYHDAYKRAREHGWAATDLTRVGFPEPKKYARLRDPKNKATQAPTPAHAHNAEQS